MQLWDSFADEFTASGGNANERRTTTTDRKLSRVVKRDKIVTRCPEGNSAARLGKEPSSIRVKKKNDTVDAIEVICACGRTMEIICEYETPVPGADTKGG